MRLRKNEKGSLALEQVLFISAIVVVGAGVMNFYSDIAEFFSGFQVTGAFTTPQQ